MSCHIVYQQKSTHACIHVKRVLLVAHTNFFYVFKHQQSPYVHGSPIRERETHACVPSGTQLDRDKLELNCRLSGRVTIATATRDMCTLWNIIGQRQELDSYCRPFQCHNIAGATYTLFGIQLDRWWYAIKEKSTMP